MRFFGYSCHREIPLETQRHACIEYCSREEHEFLGWFTDDGTKDLWHRDGWKDLLSEIVREDADGIVIFDVVCLSEDPHEIASIPMICPWGLSREIEIHTTEGSLDLSEISPIIDQTVETITTVQDDWTDISRSIRMRESLNDLKDEGMILGHPPHGITTDKRRWDTDRVNEYIPDDEEEDRFVEAVEILNEFAMKDSSPSSPQPPSVRDLSQKTGISRGKIKTIWKYRETYRDIAQKYRDDIYIGF